MKNFIKEILFSFWGVLIAGFGMGSFLLPNRLSSGGFSGIATVLYYFFGWNVGIVIVLLNVPLFVFAFFRIGKKFFFKTVLSTVLMSFFIDLFQKYPLIIGDRFLACIYGGVLIGIGTGLTFKGNNSTGGSDLIVQIVKSFKVKIASGRLLNMIDIGVVLINVLFFREIEIGLYSAIAIFLDGVMIDIVFEGINFSKLIFIVSDKSDEILKCLHFDINCGATEIYGKGSYVGSNKIILMSVVNRREIPLIRERVHEIDQDAFLVVGNAREVYGLGFKSFE